MDDHEVSFRDLFHDLACYEGDQVYLDVIRPWIPCAQREMAAFEKYRQMNSAHNVYEAGEVDLTQWYALSRVNDLLLMDFQYVGNHRQPMRTHKGIVRRSIRLHPQDLRDFVVHKG